MKKIFVILIIMLMCVGADAQDVRYSQELVNKAESRDAEAMFNLGNNSYFGASVKNNYSLAVYWYKKAAENGYAQAMYALGYCYFWGLGVTQNYSQALSLWKKAAGNGDAQAMYALGYCYYWGQGVTQNYSQAVSLYKKAAENGEAQAMYNLGWCYKYGEGVTQDDSLAVYWYKKGTENGDSQSMYNLGWCYKNGEGVTRSQSKADIFYSAADKAYVGDTKGAMDLVYQVFPEMAQSGLHIKPYTKRKMDVNNPPVMFADVAGDHVIDNYVDDSQEAKELVYQVLCEAPDPRLQINPMTDANNTPIKLADAAENTAADDKAADTQGEKELAYQASSDVPEPKSQIKPQTESKTDAYTPPIIQIVPESIMFADATGNNAIDANETCSVRFKVRNIGKGAGYKCVARVVSSTSGITAGDKNIDEIKAGEMIDIEIPVTSSINTADGTTDLAVSVYEPNNFGCDPITVTVNTKAFVAPMLKIVDYAISNEGGGKLRKMMPFNLQMILQNTQYGNAEDVEVSIALPDNVMVLDGDVHRSFANLNAGSKKDLSYTIIANNAYNASSIPVKVSVREKYGKYAESRTINLAMNQQMSAQRIVIDENESAPVGNIEIAQIEGKVKLSDVDMNIPHNPVKDANTFAVIIANENYQNEEKVDFALNDGRVFKKYCEEALGLPSKNIRLVENATLNNILVNIDWLKNISESFTDANIIFYYAGHGIPDEKTKDAYLLPVDGYGGITRTGYNLDELYTELSSMPARQTVVFLDACFSGAQRNGDMMASARSVAISTHKAAPKGNMVVFSGAQGDETAYPYKEKQHGLFTYFLLKKLQMSKGKVTLGDLSSYIITKVKQESVVTNDKRQTPTVQPSSSMMNRWKDISL